MISISYRACYKDDMSHAKHVSLGKARIPRQERSIQTRMLILKAAEELFSARGYHKTSTKQIAKVAGVAIGSFYSYFDDKKVVFLEILRKHIETIIEKISSYYDMGYFKDKEPEEIIASFTQIVLDAHDLSPEFHREANLMRYCDEDVRRIHDELEEAAILLFMPFFQTFGERLRITDNEAAVGVILMAVEEVVHTIKIFKPKVEKERLIHELNDMIYRYLFSG